MDVNTIGVIMNLAIAGAYFGIGLYLAPRFTIAGPAIGARIARIAGVAFFVTCAMTHTELAYHALRGVAEVEASGTGVGSWFTQWHGVVVHTVQGIAGWTFFVMAAKFLSVRIFNKENYEKVLDERIEMIQRELDAAIKKELEEHT